MGFWIFMLLTVLMIPLLMIGFGGVFLKKAPGEINYLFGYRTRRSMKNKETWSFAHRYLGRIWYVGGLLSLPLSILPLLLVIGKDQETVGSLGAGITIGQLILLVGSILPTELALKKHFDEEGRPR